MNHAATFASSPRPVHPPRKAASTRQAGRRRGKALLLALMLTALLRPAAAATLAGVTLPPTASLGQTTLVLNGIGLRTYSPLRIHIYVAGLYLPKPSQDPDAILNSTTPKIMVLRFVHDVPATKVQSAWRSGLARNCPAPCTLPTAEENEFLSSLPAMSAGETAMLVFADDGMHAYFDGKAAGTVHDPQFAKALLGVFLGPNTNAPELKAALLGTGEAASR